MAGSREAELAGPAVHQVDLALDHVGPGRRVGVLEVGHEHLGPAVQGVDDHLAVGRTGDLDAAVQQVGRDRRDLPVAVAHGLGLGQEVGALAGVEALLARLRGAPAAPAGARRTSRCSSARNASASGVSSSAARPSMASVTWAGRVSVAASSAMANLSSGKRKKAGACAPTSQPYQLSGRPDPLRSRPTGRIPRG